MYIFPYIHYQNYDHSSSRILPPSEILSRVPSSVSYFFLKKHKVHSCSFPISSSYEASFHSHLVNILIPPPLVQLFLPVCLHSFLIILPTPPLFLFSVLLIVYFLPPSSQFCCCCYGTMAAKQNHQLHHCFLYQ